MSANSENSVSVISNDTTKGMRLSVSATVSLLPTERSEFAP
jgi:hypothetical protein